MKRLGTTWGSFLRAAALITAMLLAPVGASAHGAGDGPVLAGDCTEVAPDAVSAFEFGCMIPATGHRLHCHLASVPPMGAGPNQALDDDPLVMAASKIPARAAQNLGNHSAPESRIPIAAPPRFILFGNFRS